MSQSELVEKMQGRVRKHLLVSVGGIVLAVGVMGLSGAAVRSLGEERSSAAFALPALGLLLIPLIGFWSMAKNLRCPSCERNVAMQVSWNFSLFSRYAAKSCEGCGKQIFPHDTGRRFVRLLVAVCIVIAAGLAIIGAVARASSVARATQQEQR